MVCDESGFEFSWISGSQTFPHDVPFVGPILSPRTTLLQATQSTKYHSIKSLENQNRHKCDMKIMAVRNYNGHFEN